MQSKLIKFMIIKKNTERISAFNLIPNGAGQLPTSYNIFSTLDTCWNKIIVRKKFINRTIVTRLCIIPTFLRISRTGANNIGKTKISIGN